MDLFKHGGEYQKEDNIKIDFSVNINPLGIPEGVKRVLAELLTNGELSSYPDRESRALKKAIAEKENVDISNVLLGNGASELIMAICNCIKPKSAVTLKPTFSGYRYALKNYTDDITEIEDTGSIKYGLQDRDIIFICNPNNPTGNIISEQKIEEILEFSYRNDTIVVMDESFIEFGNGTSAVKFIKKYSNVIVVKAFTKFYSMAGIRLGYAIASEILSNRIFPYLPEWNISVLAQRAGCEALMDKDYKRKTLELLENEKKYIYNAVSDLGMMIYKTESNFFLIKTEEPVFEKLKKKGIYVRDCSNFSGLSDKYIRICISNHENNILLIDALKGVLNG